MRYRLGELKKWRKEREGRTSHEVAIKNNLLGWVSASEPFFAQPLAGKRHERDTLVAASWDFEEPDRDELFAGVAHGRLCIVWLSPAEAAAALWQKSVRHRRYAEPWFALLAQTRSGVEAALERTEISEVSADAAPSRT